MAAFKLMTCRLLIIALAICVVSTASAQAQVDSSALAEVNRLGTLLHKYDQAAWHGTDAVMSLIQADDDLDVRVAGYVVEQTAKGWMVGFGRLKHDGLTFAVAYESVLDSEYNVLRAVSYDEPEGRVGFYQTAMVARDSAMARFNPPGQVTYNTAVIPMSDQSIYVYVMPAQPAQRVYHLGGDYRYTFDLSTESIVEEKRLHSTVLTFDLRADPPPATIASAVLTELPTETDVFYARSRPAPAEGQASHYVLTEDWVFVLDSTGVVAHMTTEAFEKMTN